MSCKAHPDKKCGCGPEMIPQIVPGANMGFVCENCFIEASCYLVNEKWICVGCLDGLAGK